MKKLLAVVLGLGIAFCSCNSVDSKIKGVEKACNNKNAEKVLENVKALHEMDKEKKLTDEQNKQLEEALKKCDVGTLEKFMELAAKEEGLDLE